MRRALHFLPAILIAAGIFIMSHQPGDDLVRIELGWDKALHMAVYFGFGLTLAFAAAPFKGGRRRYLYIFIIGALFAASDEWHQSFMPMRDASFWDWTADVAGLLLSLLLFKKIEKLSEIISEKWKNSSN